MILSATFVLLCGKKKKLTTKGTQRISLRGAKFDKQISHKVP
jgi:hypothetical protein